MAKARTWNLSCPKCSTENRSETLRCGNCGSAEIGYETWSGGVLITCRKCLQGIPSISCTNCGCSIDSLVKTKLANETAKSCIWTGLVAGTVLLILFGMAVSS